MEGNSHNVQPILYTLSSQTRYAHICYHCRRQEKWGQLNPSQHEARAKIQKQDVTPNTWSKESYLSSGIHRKWQSMFIKNLAGKKTELHCTFIIYHKPSSYPSHGPLLHSCYSFCNAQVTRCSINMACFCNMHLLISTLYPLLQGNSIQQLGYMQTV